MHKVVCPSFPVWGQFSWIWYELLVPLFSTSHQLSDWSMIALIRDPEIQCSSQHGFGLYSIPPKFLSLLQDLVSLWLTYQVSDDLKVCINCSIGQSNPARRWVTLLKWLLWSLTPRNIHRHFGMALKILSFPSLGNGIGSISKTNENFRGLTSQLRKKNVIISKPTRDVYL